MRSAPTCLYTASLWRSADGRTLPRPMSARVSMFRRAYGPRLDGRMEPHRNRPRKLLGRPNHIRQRARRREGEGEGELGQRGRGRAGAERARASWGREEEGELGQTGRGRAGAERERENWGMGRVPWLQGASLTWPRPTPTRPTPQPPNPNPSIRPELPRLGLHALLNRALCVPSTCGCGRASASDGRCTACWRRRTRARCAASRSRLTPSFWPPRALTPPSKSLSATMPPAVRCTRASSLSLKVSKLTTPLYAACVCSVQAHGLAGRAHQRDQVRCVVGLGRAARDLQPRQERVDLGEYVATSQAFPDLPKTGH